METVKIDAKEVAALRRLTGCSMETAKAALIFKSEHPDTTGIGYVKAKSFAVCTRGLSFERRVLRFSKPDDEI